MARPSDDGWDPGDRLRILQYKNSEFVPRIVMGDAAKNVSKEVKKHHGEIDRNAQLPLAAPTVAMRVPGQVALVLTPSWISTLAAKPPPGICEFEPSTRSSPVLTTCSARLMLTVSVPAAGGGGGGCAAAGLTVCVIAGEVLARKSASPL